MKRIFVILLFFFLSSSACAQIDPTGIWKIVTGNSGWKQPPPPQYILFKSNNYYIWGVDSLGAELKGGGSTGSWLISREGEIVMISSDTTMEIRYYLPEGKGRYKFDATQKGRIKEHSQMPEMDSYLEKVAKKEEK